MTTTLRAAALLTASLVLTSLIGCGSGGNSVTPFPTPTPTPTPVTPSIAKPKLTVNWPARSRGNFPAFSSALSVRVTVVGAGTSGQDVDFLINRATNPAAYDETYVAPLDAVIGSWNVRVRFHAQADGAGPVVAAADVRVALAADGTLPNVSAVGVIRSVEIAGGQSLLAGERRDLSVTAKGQDNSVVAVSPGSFTWNVTAGGERLRFENGQAVAVLPGSATVTATVDGVTSDPVSVAVTSEVSVSVSPNPALAGFGQQVPFQATVNGASDGSVSWSVAPGGAGGTITAGGVYTAPSVAGKDTVIATSNFDPSKMGSASVTVVSGAVE